MSAPTSLDDMRAEVAAIDAEILAAIARRSEIVARIVSWKSWSGVPLRDLDREREILRLAERVGAGRYPSDVAVDVLSILVRAAERVEVGG